MPIPTDTYWNIKRLNWVFAVSAVVLMAVTGWSIVQDYNKDWRIPQRNGRVWEAALVTDKIDRESTPEKQQRLEQLKEQLAAQEKTLAISAEEQKKLAAQITQLISDRSNLEFKQNSEKALLTVDESQLQDAITANQPQRVKALREKIAGPREQVDKQAERLAEMAAQLKELRGQVAERTRAKTEIERERTKLTADVDLLNKKLAALEPKSLPAKLSAHLRATPLLQFINPSERARQVVLPDVQTDLGGFKRVESIDRCTTCHVHIDNRDFTEPKLLAFLEEQVSAARKLNLPATAGGKAADPVATAAKPGPVAMADFWQAWAHQLVPAAIARNAVRVNAVSGILGKDKPAIVTVDGKKLDAFKYDLTLRGDAATQQEAVFQQMLRALLSYDAANGAVAGSTGSPKVRVEIPAGADEKIITTTRNTAMRYVEELHNALRTQLKPAEFNLLSDRYRAAMVDEVNVVRKDRGQTALDASPVYLAHPNLALYVDVDSPHAFEKVGCTSCHDGSGVETDFVLAAHTARPIWVDQKTGIPVLPAQLKPKAALAAHHGPDLSSMLAAVWPHDSLVPRLASLQFDLDAHHAPAPATHPAEHGAATRSATPQAAEHEPLAVPEKAPVDAPPTPYVDPVTGRESRAVPQLTYWKKYEPQSGTSFKDVNHYWDRPMLPPQYLQANCVRCHTNAYDIKDQAPVVYEGRMLFKSMGCVNCHQMDSISPEIAPANPSDERLVTANGQRKVGADLRHITAKLSPAMINTWIWSPKAFRPTTKMPHFFMLENNSSDEELRRTSQEARAITEYLTRTATPLPPKHRLDPALRGNIENGKAVFNNIGCLGCHSNLNDTTTVKRGDKLITIGEQWIVTDLVKNGKLADQLAKSLGKAPDTKALTAEAQKLYDQMTYNERQLYALENLGERGEQSAAPKYPDNSPRPIFMHHGPELSGIGSKLLAGRSSEEARQWLFDWLKEPRHYSEYTVMPQLRLTDQQAADLAEYLLSMKRTNDAPNDTWAAGLAQPESAKLIEMTAMFLRSRFSAKTALAKADEDAELTALAVDALKPVDPLDKDGAAIAAAKVEEMSRDDKRLVFLGKKLISHYGCMSCHAINGAETLTSPCANLSDWGQKTIDKLDFGFLDHHKVESMPNAQSVKVPLVNGLSAKSSKLAGQPVEPGTAGALDLSWPHVEHSRTSWITHKLKNTRVFDRGKVLLEPRDGEPGKPYDKLKMPTFYLTDHEVDAIVTFVISNRDRLISERLHNATLTESAQRIALGRQVAEKYNCVNCHQVEQNVPAVQQYYKADEMTTEAPPSLRGQGNKVQHAWLFNFLKNVEPLRPLLHSDTLGGGSGVGRKIDVRMPSFPLEDAEAEALAAYFSAISNKESKQLNKTLDPVVKYIHAEMEAAEGPLYAESAWPGDDWFRRPEFANATEALTRWGLARGQVNPLQLDPTKNNPVELGRSYRQLLFKARFTQELYDSPFPFVDAPRPTLSKDRFKRGESLFYEMQCLKCHVLGDGSVEGAQKNPTAPNLSLTHRRLQRRWVRHWVQEPPVIQVGTAMPPFLTGLAVTRLDGLTWPKSQGAPPEEVQRVESLYGDTPDAQGDLLLDFLYAAGAANYTGIQPAKPGALEGVTPLTGPTTAPTTAPTAATTKPSTQASTQPAAKPQPIALLPEFGKEVLPGKAPEAPKAATPALASEKPAPTPRIAGVKVAGKVTFKGKPPELGAIAMGADAGCTAQHGEPVPDPSIAVSESGEVQNVIISVEGVAGAFAPLTTPAVLDQKGCMYQPHVLAAQVGQPFVIKNSDPFLHNVHSLAAVNEAFNFGQPNKDPGKNIGSMKAAEQFRVKCDVHPWMSAYVQIFDHPFFAVSKADGAFAIENVPPGTYKLTAWHEKFGTQQKDVTVEAGKPLTADFTFSEGSASVNPSPVMKLVTLAMLGASAGQVEVSRSAPCPTCSPLAASRTNGARSATPQAAEN
ncbi:MAG: c-type cytochrome [Tepidisphaeraceae bacterium]